MDTWATSSLTPQIVTGWVDDPDLFERTFPMDMRPQAHEIIRTWLFYTVVRSHYEHDALPWANAAISGFVSRPRPQEAVEVGRQRPRRPQRPRSPRTAPTPSATGRRAGGRALDLALDAGQMKIGRRLAIKLLNASKFALGLDSHHRRGGHRAARPGHARRPGRPGRRGHRGLRPLRLRPGAVERTEDFFWSFCDDYLELVKSRAYGADGDDGAASARTALGLALRTLLGLFAPFLPFVTEEVWSWWQEGSVHRSPWPDADALREVAEAGAATPADEPDPAVLAVVAAALSEVRKAKSEAKRSMRTEVDVATVTDTPDRLALLALAADDLRSAGRIADLRPVEGEALAVEVALAAEA